jgi:hypothetical protein
MPLLALVFLSGVVKDVIPTTTATTSTKIIATHLPPPIQPVPILPHDPLPITPHSPIPYFPSTTPTTTPDPTPTPDPDPNEPDDPDDPDDPDEGGGGDGDDEPCDPEGSNERRDPNLKRVMKAC